MGELPADGGQDDAPSVDKFWGGWEVSASTVVGIAHSEGKCTAVPFFKKGGLVALLTSAHCVPNTKRSGSIDVWRSDGVGATVGLGTHVAYIFPHPDYDHATDTPVDADIAVLLFDTFPKGRVAGNSLWLGNITKNDKLKVLGFGTTRDGDSEGFGILRTGIEDGIFSPDYVKAKYFGDNDDDDVFMCAGDSGGPAIMQTYTYPVAALASRTPGRGEDHNCRKAGKKQEWTRIGPHIAWIEKTIATKCDRYSMGAGKEIAHCGEY